MIEEIAGAVFGTLLGAVEVVCDALMGPPRKSGSPQEGAGGDFGSGVKALISYRECERIRNRAKGLKKYLRQTRLCAKCDTRHDLTVHHIKPVCLGGGNEVHNLEVLCQSCHTNWNRLCHKGIRKWSDFHEWIKRKKA